MTSLLQLLQTTLKHWGKGGEVIYAVLQEHPDSSSSSFKIFDNGPLSLVKSLPLLLPLLLLPKKKNPKAPIFPIFALSYPIFHLRAVAAILPPPFCLLRAEHRAAPKGKRSDFWGKFRRFWVFWTPIPLERDFWGVFRSDLGSFFGEKTAFSGFCGQKKRCPPPPSLSAMGPPRPLMNINDLEGSALELVNIDSPHEY